MRKSLFVSLIAALSVGAISQECANISWNPKEGDKTVHRISVNIDVQGAVIAAKIRSESRVAKIAEDGKVTLEGTERMESFSLDGQELDPSLFGEPGRIKAVMDKNGEIISWESDPPDFGPGSRIKDASVIIYPGKAVKVGESWVRTRSADETKGIRASKTTYTYLGSENVGDELAYKVKIEFSETEGSAPMTYTATAWLSATNGELIKLDGRIQNLEVDPSAPAGNATIQIERIKV